MTALDVVFALFASTAAAGALLAVTSRHVVHAALWLVLALGSLAGVYLVLAAEVVALVQVLVYVGAVVVLVLFALMLTRAPIGVRADLDAAPGRRRVAAVAGLATSALIGGTLLAAIGSTAEVPAGDGTASALGSAIFTGWVLPFELLSVLLLAALVAAIAISRGRDADTPGLDDLAPGGTADRADRGAGSAAPAAATAPATPAAPSRAVGPDGTS